ncbi:transposase [Luteimonas abyssi]|uniref:transposase n=1 Tax=Luteimonas abyssi TaxID=1247514 RepID=UPI0009E6DC7E|nr:transposase [Luteimonas abyssi]
MTKVTFHRRQIVRILRETEAGAKVAETYRKHGISEPTYYAWKDKHSSMEMSQLRWSPKRPSRLAPERRRYETTL